MVFYTQVEGRVTATIVGLNLSFAFVWLEDSCGLDACVTPDLNVEALALELGHVRRTHT